jgi:hypothetical protein
MRQQWFARPLADGEMVIDEPGRVVQIHRYDPALDEFVTYRLLTSSSANETQGHQVRPPRSWWG